MANDIGIIFNTQDYSRPASSSDQLQRFKSGGVGTLHPQGSFMNYLAGSRNPSYASTPGDKGIGGRKTASIEALNKFQSPEGRKLNFTHEKIIQEASQENENLLSREGENIVINDQYLEDKKSYAIEVIQAQSINDSNDQVYTP